MVFGRVREGEREGRRGGGRGGERDMENGGDSVVTGPPLTRWAILSRRQVLSDSDLWESH